MTRSHWPALAGGIFGLTAMVAMPAVPAFATTYDAAADFSTTNNPNGVWSYRDGSGNRLTDKTTIDGLGVWTNNAGWDTNVDIVSNPTGTEQGGSIMYRPHELTVDGQSLGADVRFTAAVAGTYTVTGLFEPNDTTGNSHTVSISENGSTTLFSGISTDSPTFDFDVALNVGDYLDFLSADDNGPSFDSTGLKATLTDAVPEPASLALLGFGLLGLGLIRRRKLETQ